MFSRIKGSLDGMSPINFLRDRGFHLWRISEHDFKLVGESGLDEGEGEKLSDRPDLFPYSFCQFLAAFPTKHTFGHWAYSIAI